MADDWSEFNPQPAQGAAAPAAAPVAEPAGKKDDWSEFNPQPDFDALRETPAAFKQRLERGHAVADLVTNEASGTTWTQRAGDTLKSLWSAAREGNAAGYDADGLHQQWAGYRKEIDQMEPGYAKDALSVAEPVIEGMQNYLHTLNGIIMGAGAATGQAVSMASGENNEAMQARARRDWAQMFAIGPLALGEDAAPAMVTRDGNFARLHHNPVDGKIEAQVVGKMPTPEIFAEEAGKIPGPSNVVQHKLVQKWTEEGLHPAEVTAAAEKDAMLRHDLGAAATSPDQLPPNTPTSIQPLSPPGRTFDRIKAAIKDKIGFADDLEKFLTPISTGAPEIQAAVKQTASNLRREVWDWTREDNTLLKEFTEAEREDMWEVGNRRSELLQEGLVDQAKELENTLSPRQLQKLNELQDHLAQTRLDQIEAGMVEGEGLPSYTPRMIRNMSRSGDEPIALAKPRRVPTQEGGPIKTRTGTMNKRKYLSVEDTEEAAKKAFGDDAEVIRDIRTLPLALRNQRQALIGRRLINEIEDFGSRMGTQLVSHGVKPAAIDGKEWFTIPESPAFHKWQPMFRDGKVVKDEDGATMFEKKPIYVHPEAEGPLRALMDQKFAGPGGKIYDAFITLKSKVMSVQMLSPVVHNLVEFGRAFPAFPREMMTLAPYRRGAAMKMNPARMQWAIEHGLYPIQKNWFRRDITSEMEPELQMKPGRSWTSQIVSAVPDLFSETAGDKVRSAVDKIGDFKNNTLLWDRVSDLQAGMFDLLEQKFKDQGAGPHSAAINAAYLANNMAGAIPIEAMSKWSRATANVMLFSRSFTLGTLGLVKAAVKGLPEAEANWIASLGEKVGPDVKVFRDYAQRKAASAVLLDLAFGYAGISLFQSAINVMLGNGTLLANMGQEAENYVRRFHAMMAKVNQDPTELLHPMALMEMLSATYDNDPNKTERLRIGTNSDGSARYVTFPLGRTAFDIMGWAGSPIQTLKNKLSFAAGGVYKVLANDTGYGAKIYDPDAELASDKLHNVGNIFKALLDQVTPASQIYGGYNLLAGKTADPGLDALRLTGPWLGVSASKGYPGGPAAGLAAENKRHLQAVQDREMPAIKQMIMQGQVSEAREAMKALDIDTRLQKFYLKAYRQGAQGASRYSPYMLRQFYQTARPDEIERFERMRGGQ